MLPWPYLHMAWGHACWQWLGMGPLMVDECAMKEGWVAQTMGAPPACHVFVNMPPKFSGYSHIPPNQGQRPKINFSKPIINSPTPNPSTLPRLPSKSLGVGCTIINHVHMMHAALGPEATRRPKHPKVTPKNLATLFEKVYGASPSSWEGIWGVVTGMIWASCVFFRSCLRS